MEQKKACDGGRDRLLRESFGGGGQVAYSHQAMEQVEVDSEQLVNEC